MNVNLPIIAGTISTIIFALSTLPMLVKAFRTKNLKSYSLGNILLSNIGNVIHSIYIFNLPPGPIWLLHSFYLVTTCLMLVWYLRYEWHSGLKDAAEPRTDFSVKPARELSSPQKYPAAIPHSGNVTAA